MSDKALGGGKGEDALRDLLELHRQKHVLLAEMLRVTTQMIGLNEVDQAAEIVALLQERQGYIDRIDVVDAQISKHSGVYDKMPEIGEQRLLCLKLVGEIQGLDRLQQQKMARHFEAIKKLQGKIKAGRQTINAYHKRPSETASVFIDQKE